MAPTTLPNQRTATSPKGRDVTRTGQPLNIINQITQLPVGYVARGSVHTPRDINQCKKYLRSAFENQMQGGGYGLVEILSPCPTNWKMSTIASLAHIQDTVKGFYPTGEFIKNGEKTHD